MNVTEKQKRILLNYMKVNEDVARGRLRYNSGNKKILDDMWTSITTSLNATGNGPQKQAKEWQKTWRDWKSNVLKKCAQNKNHAGGTGGGPPKVLQLTELEENLLEIIGPEAAGLDDIPEGGNFNRTRGSHVNDTSPKRKSFHTSGGSCETIAQKVLEEQRQPNSVQIKRKCNTLDSNNKIYKIDDIANYSSSTSEILNNTDFSAREVENDINNFNCNVFDSDIEEINDIVLVDKNTNTNTAPHRQIISERHQTQGKASKSDKENQSSAAVQLMHDNIELKQEILKLSKEKLQLEKEKFAYFKNISSNYKDILSNVDTNIMLLREEIAKIVPSYLIDESLNI